MRQSEEEKNEDAFLGGHQQEVKELNHRVCKIMALYSVLTNTILLMLSLFPGTVLSSPGFRRLFLVSSLF